MRIRGRMEEVTVAAAFHHSSTLATHAVKFSSSLVSPLCQKHICFTSCPQCLFYFYLCGLIKNIFRLRLGPIKTRQFYWSVKWSRDQPKCFHDTLATRRYVDQCEKPPGHQVQSFGTLSGGFSVAVLATLSGTSDGNAACGGHLRSQHQCQCGWTSMTAGGQEHIMDMKRGRQRRNQSKEPRWAGPNHRRVSYLMAGWF